MPHEPQVWIHGGLVPEDAATVSPLDRGFALGDGVFETLRAYQGKPFATMRHWTRLENSCKKICIRPPELDAFTLMMDQTLRAGRLEEARVRVTVTAGRGGGLVRSLDQPSTVVCTASQSPRFEGGEKVVVVPWTRNEGGALAGIKSTSYGEGVLAQSFARKQGAGEAIFGNTRGELCEGATSNLFLVYEGRLTTPPLSSGCLPGVTRALVLELCEKHNIPVCQDALPLEALGRAEEAFLTSSTREVQSISHVNGMPLSRSPGPLGQELAALLRKLISENQDP